MNGCRFRREIRCIDIILNARNFMRVISYNFIGHIIFLLCCILRNRVTPQRCILWYVVLTHRRARKWEIWTLEILEIRNIWSYEYLNVWLLKNSEISECLNTGNFRIRDFQLKYASPESRVLILKDSKSRIFQNFESFE